MRKHSTTLDQRIRNYAFGAYGSQAAARLLIAHDTWLRRSDFHAACIHDRPTDRLAWVDYRRAAAFLATAPCSSSEARILLLAGELDGVDSGRPLDDLLSGLDDPNSRLVLDAIEHMLTRGQR